MTGPRKTLRHSTDYRDQRAAAYRPVTDQLDAILKGLAAYTRGEPLPLDTLECLAEWEGVKARFPKAATPPTSKE